MEDLAGVGLAVPDELDEVGQEAAHRGRTAEGVDAGEEQLDPGDGHVVVHAHAAQVPAAAGGADGLHERLLGADRLDHRVSAEPAGEFLDPRHALVAAFFDDVGGAVAAGQPLALGVAGHGHDALCAQLFGGEYGHESDRAVADDRDGLAGAGLGGDERAVGVGDAPTRTGSSSAPAGRPAPISPADTGTTALAGPAERRRTCPPPASPARVKGEARGETKRTRDGGGEIVDSTAPAGDHR